MRRWAYPRRRSRPAAPDRLTWLDDIAGGAHHRSAHEGHDSALERPSDAGRRSSGPWPGGRFVVPLDIAGKQNGEISHHDQDLQAFDEVTVARVGSGFVVALARDHEATVIEQLDASGQMLRTRRLDEGAYSKPSLLYAHGHLYVAFVEQPPLEDAPNRVLAYRLSCDPKAAP